MRRSSTASLPCLIVFLRRYLYYGLIAIQVVLIDQVVVGEATGPLLGGKYTPTTDVDAFVELSELIEAISKENDITNGTNLYKLTPPNGKYSLESLTYSPPQVLSVADTIAGDSSSSSKNDNDNTFLKSSNNPLYNIYMYAMWRSTNGSGARSSSTTTTANNNNNNNIHHEMKSQMKFLDEPISHYIHTIIMDEYTKTSGYDPSLTAETIKVTNIWMSVVQSLYNTVTLCESGTAPNHDDGTTFDEYSNSIDIAAALWFGNLQSDNDTDMMKRSGGTMFAWAEEARSRYVSTGDASASGDTLINVNDKIVQGLNDIQSMLSTCYTDGTNNVVDGSNNGNSIVSSSSSSSKQMRQKVDELVRYMTVPLVQNLIYYSSVVATGSVPPSSASNADIIDWVILYGLVAIPNIIICDETVFDQLYAEFITNAKDKSVSRDTLTSTLRSLYSRLLCHGLDCSLIGVPKLLADDTISEWPTCLDEESVQTDFKGYQGSNPNQLLEWMKMDLDVRTIGTLIEMDAATAAYDVHHWGLNSRGMDGNTIAIQDMAMISPFNVKNTVGLAFKNDLSLVYPNFPAAASTFADTHEYQSMMGLEVFGDTSNSQRRIITEAAMVTITMHIYALDSFYMAVDDCRAGQQETTWDRGFAAISGWAEEDSSASGFLFMRVARFLCRSKPGSCNAATNDSNINALLMAAVTNGKGDLANMNEAGCAAAEEKVDEIEKLLQAILVDSTAYFAQKLSEDIADDDKKAEMLAEGYGLAVALVPLIRAVDETSANTIESNMATWGLQSGTTPSRPSLPDGKDAVFAALNSFVAKAGIDCCLLTMGGSMAIGCDDSCGGETNMGEPIPAVPSPLPASSGSPTQKPVSSTATITVDPDEATYNSYGASSCKKGSAPPLWSWLGGANSQLLGGAYIPTTNVDHIVTLTDNIQKVSETVAYTDAVAAYKDKGSGDISLECLSVGTDWDVISALNPLFVTYMYGLWMSDDGDNDSDGYSNKLFDDKDLLTYGNTIVMDEFDKSSGFDAKLTAETIRVIVLWMSATTELYSASQKCRDGSVNTDNFNPVDFAAAFWFGNSQDPNLFTGESLYAWAKRSEQDFNGQQFVVDDITTMLKELQASYEACKGLAQDQQAAKGLEMKHKADNISRVMTVPIVQRFIHHLATESGLTDDPPSDERNYMVLYALLTLPHIAICDEDTFDDGFADYIQNIDSYDSGTFAKHMKTFQDRFECFGITCDMVGVHSNSETWPVCNGASRAIAGYEPSSEASLDILKIDMDVSTVLSFIIMGANNAALDIYENGRFAISSDGTNAPISIKGVSNPTNMDVKAIYEGFTSGNDDYTLVTTHAIMGQGPFELSSLLKNSAAASLSIATIDVHLYILDNLYEATRLCFASTESLPPEMNAYWDRAVAATVGWTEGTDEGGSIDGYLFFQIAQELCENWDSCGNDGQSIINTNLMNYFKTGQQALKNGQCEDAKSSQANIEKLLQAILIDNLAYHAKFTDISNSEEVHCLMAYVARNALVPLIRKNTDETNVWGSTIENNIAVSSKPECSVSDIEAVYDVLKYYVEDQGIDCAWLGSSVCDGESNPVDSVGYEDNADYTIKAEDDGHTLLNGEYEPLTEVRNVQDISTKVNAICTSASSIAAQNIYAMDNTAGITIQDMSLTGKYVMKDELQFNQYIFGLKDSVDKTAGTFLFDSKPASDYAHTIVSDAMDTSVTLGCRAIKVLNIWMWIVHKLNTMVDECQNPTKDLNNMGMIDEAAALWEGSQLFAMAESNGPLFGHSQVGGMTYLNRKIVDRFVKAQDIVSGNQNLCTNEDTHNLRIVVKETVSFMTAVLIQELIESMLKDSTTIKEKIEEAELMAFAVLPHIATCGHQAVYRQLYDILITDGFDEAKLGDVITQLQSNYNCLGLTCKDIGRSINDSSEHPECLENLDIAGYSPVNVTKTNMLAKLDLDAVAIHQLMVMDQHEVAKRIYMEGHNYYDYDLKEYAFVSLYNLTQSNTIDYTEFPEYELFDEYHGEDWKHNLFLEIFDATNKFAATTASQRELAVNYAISGIVSYMSALEALYFSLSRCENAGSASAIDAFDGAVALLIGSVEGRGTGGSIWQEGRMFYSIGKRNCLHFRNCRGGDAEANVQLMEAFKQGQDLIQQGTEESCSAAGDLVHSIAKLLAAPLIQSVLYFSDSRIAGHEDNDAAGYVATEAALPLIDNIESEAADSIANIMDLNKASTTDDVSKGETVQSALNDMFANLNSDGMVDCSLVTNIQEMCRGEFDLTDSNVADDQLSPEFGGETGLVDEDEEDDEWQDDDEEEDDDEAANELPPEVDLEKPMPISNGMYVATSFVGDRSAISKDIDEIKDFLDEGDAEGATHTYVHGLYSKIYNENGIMTGQVRSVQKFSMEAADTMKGDPTYNLFVYGLSDDNHEFMGRPATTYADTFVSNLLLSGSQEAANAMVAITIWMQVAHSLHSAYGACKRSFLTDGRTINGRSLQNSDPSLYIDEAAAYWIGDNQETGSYGEGHLLYALTEFIGGKFEDNPSGVESDINNRVISLFNQAKNHIAISRGCSTSKDSHLKLKSIIDELIPMMAVPLLRSLIYYVSIDDPIMVKVYATAVLPLFSACAPATYYELKDELIDHSVIEIQKEYIYSKIQSMYSCLGLTCDLIGSPKIDDIAICGDDVEWNSLAGYKYVTDHEIFNHASHIDVDMRKVQIFIENGMHHFDGSQEVLFGTAYDLYRYGQRPGNSVKGSLSSIARDTRKDVVPVFAAFRRYYGSDPYYADTMIVKAFQGEGVFKDATADQRKRFIVFALRYMITHMAILEMLYSALLSCKGHINKGSSIEDGTRSLDLGVAYFIGSLEGKEDGGSYDGSLIHMLAKRMCVHFGTCNASNHARINERVISLFYAAQGELEKGACVPLEKTVKEIESALIVPLIQGVLFSARGNELYFKSNLVGAEFYPEGFALAQSILPIIDDADQSAAVNIKNIMVASFPNQATDDKSNDFAKVQRTMKAAIAKMGVDCEQVGTFGGYGFCPGDVSNNSSSGKSLSLMALALTGVLSLFVLL